MCLVAINTEITPTLKAEVLYRELLRHCQLVRKEAGFSISDKIVLFLQTDSKAIKSILEEYCKNIERETLSELRDIPAPVMQKR